MINKRILKKIVFLLLASLSIFLVTVTHAAAQQLPFYWDNINVIIDVQKNGDMLVTETQKYVFTADYNNERYRYIPLDKVDEIKDVTVAENNQIIPSSTGTENNQLWIRWQHELKPPDTHTFVIKYRVVGGLQLDGENTQVYWKAIAAGRKAPINTGKVTVRLPEALSGKVLSFTNFGAAAVPRQVDPKTFEFVASQAIPPEQELEVQIAFPQAILNVPQPGWQQSGKQSQSTSGEKTIFVEDIMEEGSFMERILWFFTFLPFFAIFLTLTIILPIRLIIRWIDDRRCPECKQLKLKSTYKVLIRATTSRPGKRYVTHHCGNCSYHKEYEQVIPVISDDSGGGGGGGGDR
ncbi:DUF2207 domain-containing protein, partial [Microcoleus sp. herbarium7]|uniref:DUF2207 domain-containing protein n=1 Tax=Microcoleus sp. herbarium7 TaxID=3055435 RepID=UPI002FD6DA81